MADYYLQKTKPFGDNANELIIGFIHDLNNLFTCAIGSICFAQANDDNPVVQKEMIEIASTTIIRASELASLMLLMYRGQDMPKEPIDIQTLIRDSVKLARQAINAKIEIEMPQKICCVQANRLAIMNVVINLLLNADCAITSNETIIIPK